MKKLIFALFTLVLSFKSYAENVNDTITYNLDEVSVVSFYRNNLTNSNVLTKEYLLKTNKGQEPSFIFNSLPSVFAYSDTGNEYGYSYYRMRGMDQTRINVTLDGMPLNEGEDMGVYFSNFPDLMSSVNSIQIDKGASISNNGTSGYAGSINFESAKLSDNEYTNIYFGGGSFNTFKTNAEYNSSKIGKWAFNVRATTQQSDGYRNYAYNNSQSLFAKVGYYINEKHTIDFLTFSGLSRNGQGWIGSTLEELAIDRKHNGCSENETDRFIQTINKLQYKGFVSDNSIITASVYYNHLNGKYNFDVDNFMIKIVDPTWAKTNEIDTYNLKHDMVGGNFAIKTYWDKFTWTNGVNASTFSRRHIGTWNFDDSELWRNTGYKNDVNVFTKGKYTLNKVEIGANLQYRHADFDYKGDVPFEKINWDFLNFGVDLNYKFAKNFALYGMVTHTHREPTRTDMFGGEENFKELYTKQAESVYDYELGINHNSEKLSFNINAFYMDFDNELILNGESGTNGLPIRVNSANSYRTGVELTLDYKPFSWLQFVNNSSWSKNHVIDGEEKYNHVMSPDWLVGQDVIFTINNFNIGVNMKYRSKMYIDLLNKYDLDGNVKFNLYADCKIKNVTIGAKVNNVFNKTSYSNGMLGANGALYFIDAPTNFMVDARFTF